MGLASMPRAPAGRSAFDDAHLDHRAGVRFPPIVDISRLRQKMALEHGG